MNPPIADGTRILCIGGPKAGVCEEYYGVPFFKCSVHKGTESRWDVHIYYLESMIVESSVVLMWRHSSLPDWFAVMNELTMSYAKAHSKH